MAGKKRNRRRYSLDPKYREALGLRESARAAMRTARASGDESAITDAENLLQNATELMAAANVAIFERLVSERAFAMQHAVEQIITLASQRRYIVRQHHADTLVSAMENSLGELRQTLAIALTRTTTTTRRRIVFATPGRLDVFEREEANVP